MSNKKKIGLVGYLGYSVKNPIIGGQMSKTRGIYQELRRKYGDKDLIVIDTSNWKNEKLSLIFGMAKMGLKCDPIIIMPNKNGIKIILPFFSVLKKVFNYSLAYPIVGGWLTNLLELHKYLIKAIKNVDYILPETKQLRNELSAYFEIKMDVMSIFSTRKPVSENQVKTEWYGIKTFCTFSRVTPEKGIDEAIEAINVINRDGKICHLDIWGPIDPDYKEHYEKLFREQKDQITYKGILSEDKGLEVFSDYYMMLFPTYYPGEGFPTSICESFMAGLPVIASDWRFNKELVIDGKTGFLFPVHDINKLSKKILECINNTEVVNRMKYEALNYSKKFKPDVVTADLFNWIDSVR
ncbi:glycosyltransferase [uncultured Traorella sp.]|uniref:glycosyltransferase family 4 protein n=1 Tax=uncultured Traorella sp. TaxID=1929048 RepID=UPI0025EAB2E1|nr:glycosyltransferase [uncultured Traorella sp.]